MNLEGANLRDTKANLILLFCLILYLLITLPLSDWIIDDAGITFSYARSLAGGHGLVSQPGMEPVEGYSNFLWLIFMVPFFILGIFDPYVIPKIISFLLVAVTYLFVHKSLYSITKSYIVSFVVLLSISLNASFVIWTCSGLENPLYIALISILFYSQLKILSENKISLRDGVVSAFLATAIGLTRPDGILYAIIFPVTLLIYFISRKESSIKPSLQCLGAFVLSFLGAFGSFILFRWLYFGAIYPNTYFAKATNLTVSIDRVLTLQQPYLSKLTTLLGSVVTLKGAFLTIVILIALSTMLLIFKKETKSHILILTFLFISGFIYLILPVDWMGEYRFATAFFVFFYILLFVQLFSVISLTKFQERTKLYMMTGLSVCIIGVTLWKHVPRFKSAYKNKIVSFERIAKAYAFKFNELADEMQIKNGSVLLPDIGGTLYYSNLKVYDMVGLCDKVIAKTLRNDKETFYNYVFEEIKPTYIHIHGNWTLATNFDSDERFRRDYQPINEYQDEWIIKQTGKLMMSGDYVRKDALKESENEASSKL